MDQTAFIENLIELRIMEMETRRRILAELKEYQRNKLWKLTGHSSLSEFCKDDLGYEPYEVREILIEVGLILPSKGLIAKDTLTQAKIDALKAWRKRKASFHGLAPYRILTNRTLLKLAERKPATLEDLSEIPGIGPHKIEKYGEDLLSIFAEGLG